MRKIIGFINKDVLGGVFLLLATIMALIIANSGFANFYNDFFNTKFTVSFGTWELSKHLTLWINDGLMAIFFFLIGLELKKELFQGHLKKIDDVIVPGIAAIGGVVIPVLIYLIYNGFHSEYAKGWAIPMATDIAFSIGILALFGKMVSSKMRIFLLTLAIIDDLLAIIVIAVFHTENISGVAFLFILGILFALFIANRVKTENSLVFIILGLFLWFAVLKSGVHATLAGVALAFFIPLKKDGSLGIFQGFEKNLAPITMFFIMPLFAFANTGISVEHLTFDNVIHGVSLGIILGLVIGKPLGIFGFTMIYCKLFKKVLNISKEELLIVGFLAGIGFTMSLFIAGLTFSNSPEVLTLSRLGIVLASGIAISLSIVLMIIKVKRKNRALSK